MRSPHHLPPQYLLHLLPLRQFIDQFVQVSGLACYGILEVFDAVTANEAGDEMRIWMQGRPLKEGLEGYFFLDQVI